MGVRLIPCEFTIRDPLRLQRHNWLQVHVDLVRRNSGGARHSDIECRGRERVFFERGRLPAFRSHRNLHRFFADWRCQ